MTNRPEENARARQIRLAEIRRAVDAGTYDTPDRLSAAVDALYEDLKGRAKGSERPRHPK